MRRSPDRSRWAWLIALAAAAAVLGGCRTTISGEVSSGVVNPAAATPTHIPAAATTLPPSPTATENPTQTATITQTPTPTLHPMSILALRQTQFPGSPITVEETLAPGGKYHRLYAYYLSEGNKIYGLLTVPYGDPPAGGWPAIVFNHGYIPPDVYRTTERYIAYVDYLARSGYVVYRIDYRGHDRSEGEARGAYGNPGYTVDVLNAVASIKAYPDVNPERIGMWGHSMGGYLTLRAMVISNEIKAGVIWAGVVGSYPDMLTRWRRNPGASAPTAPPVNRGWRTQWLDDFGTPEDNPDFWSEVSANSYLSEISGPVQLHHGTADTSVPLEFSQTLADRMTVAGQAVELYIYEGDDHNLATYFSLAMARTVEFFDQALMQP